MTRIIPPPTLSDDVKRGHSSECLDLDIRYYPDLCDQIKTVAAQALTLLEADNVMENDMALAVLAEELTGIHPKVRVSYGDLLSRMMKLKGLFASSSLSPAEQEAIWQPIAECYAAVVNALAERIPPLEEREVLGFGSIFTAPVTFTKIPTTRGFVAHVKLPRFRFAAEFDRADGTYPLTGVTLLDSFLDKLPKEALSTKFSTLPQDFGALCIAKFSVDLPLRVVEPILHGRAAIVEIPEGALEKALAA